MIGAKTKIKNLREINNLSIDEMSKIIGLPKGTILEYENGKRNPRPSTYNRIVKAVEDYLSSKPRDIEIEDRVDEDYNGTVSTNKPNYDSYVMCVDRLFNRCGELIRCVHDGRDHDIFLLNVSKDISNLSSSIHFMFHRTSLLLEPFDEKLVAFTVKNTINKIIDSFNAIKLISDAIIKSGEKKLSMSNIRMNLRESLHNIRYLVFYINDYFKLESDTTFILEKSDGTLYSLSKFHEEKMKEAQ